MLPGHLILSPDCEKRKRPKRGSCPAVEGKAGVCRAEARPGFARNALPGLAPFGLFSLEAYRAKGPNRERCRLRRARTLLARRANLFGDEVDEKASEAS